MSLEAWALATLVALLCTLAAAAAVYLTVVEVRASRRAMSLETARRVAGYHEPGLLPLGTLQRLVTRLLARSGPRVRIGGALSGLAGVVLVVTGGGDIRIFGTCTSVCVVRVEDNAHTDLDAATAGPALTRAVTSTQAPGDPGMARSASIGASERRAVAPATVATEAGSPLDGRTLVDRWASRGLVVVVDSGNAACAEAGATPRPYRMSRSGGGAQRATLLVYPTRGALNADWATERGSPLGYRRGGACGREATVYWSQNAVLIIPEVTDHTTRQILTEELFSMH